MASHLFITFSNPLAYRELFPLVDLLMENGEDVELIKPSGEVSFYVPTRKRKYMLPNLDYLDYYSRIYGFNKSAKELKNLHHFNWVNESQINYDNYDYFWGLNSWIDDAYFLKQYPHFRKRYIGVPQLKPGIPDDSMCMGPFVDNLGWPHFDWLYEAGRRPYEHGDGYVLYMKSKFYDAVFYNDNNTRSVLDTDDMTPGSSYYKELWDTHQSSQNNFFEELIQRVVGDLKKHLIIKSISVHPFHEIGNEQYYLETAIQELCSKIGVPADRVIVTDEFSPRFYKSAELIVTHGSSEVFQALMLNDHLAILDYPQNSRSRMLKLPDGSGITSSSDIYGPNYLERSSSVRNYLLSRFKPPTFDGMCSERIVQRVLEYRPDSLRTYFIGAVARVSRLVKRYNKM